MSKVIETTIRNHYQRAFASAALLLAMALPSCGTTDEPIDEPIDPPLATLAGSEQASQLGVATWEVRADGENVRVIGLDTHSERQAEMLVRKMAKTADRVQIEVVHPMQGEFELSPTGEIEGAASEDMQRLAAALVRDLGRAGESGLETRVEKADPEAEDLGSKAEDLGSADLAAGGTLLGEGHINFWGGWGGTSQNPTVGGNCQQGFIKDHYEAYSSNGASCWIDGWATSTATDCRVRLHYGAGPFWSDTCNWFVYGDPAPTNSYPYQAAFTNYAQQSTADRTIFLSAGQTLTIGTCGVTGASATGDTFLRLNDPSNVQVGENDDNCGGLGSLIVRTAATTGNFTIRAGCYSNLICSGTVAWTIQ